MTHSSQRLHTNVFAALPDAGLTRSLIACITSGDSTNDVLVLAAGKSLVAGGVSADSLHLNPFSAPTHNPITQLHAKDKSLYAVDSGGSLYSYSLESFDLGQRKVEFKSNFVTKTASYPGAVGAATVSVQPNGEQIAVSHFWDNNLSVVSNDGMILSNAAIDHHPVQVVFVDDNVAAVLEWGSITIRDTRDFHHVAVTIPLTMDDVYRTMCGGVNCLAVGGGSRVLSVYDIRTWNCENHWRTLLKHEIQRACFSPPSSELVFVCDDNSVQWGKWRQPLKRANSYNVGERLSSRPVGMVSVRQSEAWVLDEEGIVTRIEASSEDTNPGPTKSWRPH